jgi:fusion and transport protein UGO1
MAVLESPPYKLEGGKELESTVKLGEYRGVVGTIWLIAREEGVRENPLSKGKKGKGKVEKELKGQGIHGLWRGWRVGMWGLVGTSRALSGGSGGNGGEF